MSLSKQPPSRPYLPLSGIAAAFKELADDAREAVVDCYSYVFLVTQHDDATNLCVSDGTFGTVAHAIRSRAADVIAELTQSTDKDSSDNDALVSPLFTLMVGTGLLSIFEPTGISSTLALCGLSTESKLMQVCAGAGMCVCVGILFDRYHEGTVDRANFWRGLLACAVSAGAYFVVGYDAALPHMFTHHFSDASSALLYAKNLVVNPLILLNVSFVAGPRAVDMTGALVLSTVHTGLMMATCMPAFAPFAPFCLVGSGTALYILSCLLQKSSRSAGGLHHQNASRVCMVSDMMLGAGALSCVASGLAISHMISDEAGLAGASLLHITFQAFALNTLSKSRAALEAATVHREADSRQDTMEPASEPAPQCDEQLTG